MGYSDTNIMGRPEHRARIKWLTDVAILGVGAIVFVTGLVLMTTFHMGGGSSREAAFGLTRLTWMNLHRLSALAFIPGLVVHVVMHWRIIAARVFRTPTGVRGKARAVDLVLYFGFAVVILEGLIAWLILPGASPLSGPVTLTHLVPARHLCIDLHNLSGLVLLPAAVFHVYRHMGWLTRTAGGLIGRRTGCGSTNRIRARQ